ncbi:unnamed protein product [Gongylonema pulchrum]|uniref:Uncharacterized protein n=1 Tax=Gongylonema pulchrum TaxID=637853 RepID=A0A183DZY0_9BILA|nr:unnamed protein product [Gongylonema pulchrum]
MPWGSDGADDAEAAGTSSGSQSLRDENVQVRSVSMTALENRQIIQKKRGIGTVDEDAKSQQLAPHQQIGFLRRTFSFQACFS